MNNKQIALELLKTLPGTEVQDFIERNLSDDASVDDFAEIATKIYLAILAKLDANP